AEVVRASIEIGNELDHDVGHVLDGRNLVVLEVRVHDVSAQPVEDTTLAHGVAQRLRDAALDLALGVQRIHDPADLVDGHDLQHADRAGADVDLDLGEVRAEAAQAHVFGIRMPRAAADDGVVLQLTEDLVERELFSAAPGDSVPVGQMDLASAYFHESRRDLEELASHVDSGQADGRAERSRGHRTA